MSTFQHLIRSFLRYVPFLSLLVLLPLAGRASAADWAANFGGFSGASTYTQATTTDAAGNTYLAGHFESDTLTLGSITLTRIGYRDAFVAKLDASGTVLWANNLGGNGAYAWGQGISVDGSGNVYLGGHFQYGSLTTPALTKIGSQDAFAIKLDSSGATVWAKNFGGSGATVYGQGIAVDNSGNVYLEGYFSANLSTPALSAIGGHDAFAIKLDSNGATVWAKNFGGSGAYTWGNGIAVDAAGNVYLTGDFNTANLTTPALTKFGYVDAFALKLDCNGTIIWAKNFGGSGASTYGNGIAVDGNGNVYLGGYLYGANLTTPALAKMGTYDAFAFKLDSTGTIIWAKNFGGSAYAFGNGIVTDGSGNVYLGGYFYYGNLATPALTKIGSRDTFAFKLDSSGATIWAKNFGGSGASTWGNSIAVDNSGNVCLGGYFTGANFTTPALTRIGSQDAFALKLDSTGAATWAKNYGGLVKANVHTKAMATDTSGNTYLAGNFDSLTLTLGSVTLTKIGTQDAFVAKLDPLGMVLWAKNFGGSGATAFSQGIACDNSGNVYLGGYFYNTNLTTPALTMIGTQDAFALKLDSTGTITWAKNFGGGGAFAQGNGIAVDSSGNVYLSGYFGRANLTTPALTKIGDYDAFALKLSSTGTTTWAKNFGGYLAWAYGQGIAVDGPGNVYLGGYFSVYNLTTPVLKMIGYQDAFAFKLSSSGAIIWAKNFGGNGVYHAYCNGITVDSSGNVYLGGSFDGANLTTPGLTRIGLNVQFVFDAFVFKLGSSGAITWAKNFGGSGASAYGNGIAVDGSGNVYLGGYFESDNLTIPALPKIGVQDAFALKLNTTGATTWARNFGGSGASSHGYGIAVDGSGKVYLGGDFLNASLTTPALTKIGATDAFIIASSTIYQIAATATGGGAGANGTIVSANPLTVPVDGTASFTLSPNATYQPSSTVTGDCPTGSWNGNTYTTGPLTADCTVGFSFVKITYPLTLKVSGSGTVHTTTSPTTADMNCSDNCSQSYDSGSLVTLSPSAGIGYTFMNWGDSCSGSGACQVTVDGTRSVSAAFDDITPPDTTITLFPADPSDSTSFSFSFASTETGSTFECSETGGTGWRACNSPYSNSFVYPSCSICRAETLRSFGVRAKDQAGNVDPTPAAYSWTINHALGIPFDNVTDGGMVQLKATNVTGDLILNRPITFIIKGGYDSGYSTNSGETKIHGKIKITDGTVRFENIRLTE